MMKVIILSIAFISGISASSQRLLQQTSCAQVRCASGTFCTEDPIAGAQCVQCSATTCPTGQSCIEGIGCTCPNENEEYNLCGSACPAVCGVPAPDVCITVCVEGCFCADGFIRDTNGDCIPESSCTPSCGPNEIFTPCNGHCRPTCATGPNIICPLVCIPGCNCADGYILDEIDGACIPDDTCPVSTTTSEPILSEECPLRCESGFDGCNNCICDGFGNTVGCTKRGCPSGTIAPAGCSKCEIGYQLNKVTNTCDSVKVKCTNNADCEGGFKCRRDPECREYGDLSCRVADKVCVTRRGLETACNNDRDCDEANGFACLDGNKGNGRCVKYQLS